MKVHCYLGLVEPEELYADLVERSPWAEGEAAATVDAAVEAECQLWRGREQCLARSGGAAMNGHYEHDGSFYWWEPEPEDGDLADWPVLTDDEVEEGDDDEN